MPPNEVLSQLQFCRANKGATRSRRRLGASPVTTALLRLQRLLNGVPDRCRGEGFNQPGYAAVRQECHDLRAQAIPRGEWRVSWREKTVYDVTTEADLRLAICKLALWAALTETKAMREEEP